MAKTTTATLAKEPAAASPPPPATASGVTITIPIAGSPSKRYMSGRVDMDLRHSEQIIFRRIQDALEDSGHPCKGPASVLRHLVALIAEAEKVFPQ